MFNHINNFLHNEDGASAIEYGLLAALIAIIIIGGVSAIGTNLGTKFNAAAKAI